MPAVAEPWIEVGDRALRSDIEILAARGLIDGPITTWPIPAGQLERLSGNLLLVQEPEYVQMAAQRVVQRLIGDGQPQGLVPEASIRGTNDPETIRDFGTVARGKFNAQTGLILDTDHFSAGLRVSNQPRNDNSDTGVAFDGSYLSILLGNWQMYGGFIDKWYGPGWASSLILSNNARPIPKIGITRNNTQAFDNWLLGWMGPWQFDTFVGLLNGPRVDSDTILAGARFSFEPVHNLEAALTRTSELCGSNHPCNPLTAEFHFDNSNQSTNATNDEAAFDLKYTKAIGAVTISPYVQIMNEDTGPFTHAYSSYLIGSSFTGPFRDGGAQWRITAEYTDSVATLNVFDFGKKINGAAYNNSQYVDGMRYRDRTLGFSLDSDSRLFSLEGSLTDAVGRNYRLVYYRANINTSELADLAPNVYSPNSSNVVSSQPVQINQIEAGVVIPWRPFKFDLSIRYQDAQVFPEQGGKVVGEAEVSYRF